MDRPSQFRRDDGDDGELSCDPAKFNGMYTNNDFWHFVDDYLVYVRETCERESPSQGEFEDKYNS